TTRYGMYTPITFSGTYSCLNRLWAKARRFWVKRSMRSIASSRVSWNGSTASGTAPLGICELIDRVWRHQWQRACSSWSTLMTTSAPHPWHFRVTVDRSSRTSCVPEAMVWPRSSAIAESRPKARSAFSSFQEWRQYAQTRAFAVSEYRISALPQRGHLFSPSSRPELVSTIRFSARRREGSTGWSGRACSGPCGGTLMTLLGARSQPERGLLRRLVVRFRDQALVEHLLVLGELRDRVILSGCRLLGRRLLLRGLLLGLLLAGRGPGLGLAHHAAGRSHARAEHRQARTAAVLAGGLHAAGGELGRAHV